MTPKSFMQFQYKIEEQCHSFMTKLDKFSWCFPVTQNISYFRSPSPEPIYSSDGKRLNTREYRKRKEFEEMRHDAIQKMILVNNKYKPPPDYKWAWVYLFTFLHNLNEGCPCVTDLPFRYFREGGVNWLESSPPPDWSTGNTSTGFIFKK